MEVRRDFPGFAPLIGFRVMRISHYVGRTSVLGPYSRSALWVHGCCFSCEGCLAKEMNAGAYKEYSPEQLADIFKKFEGVEGITISGGEPFLQADEITHMLDRIKKSRDYGVIIYSGFTLEELKKKNDTGVRELIKHTDILIDGQYVEKLDDGKPFRGSSNQQIHLLSERYREVYSAYYEGVNKRNIEINVAAENVYMVGVPSKNGIEVWEHFKKKADGNRDGI